MSSSPDIALLRIALPPDDAWTELEWAGFDSRGNLIGRGTNTTTTLPAHRETEISLPANRISAHLLSLPEQPGKHLESLITQALEDHLLGDKADVFHIAGPQSGLNRLVWVCSKSWLDAQLAKLNAAGLMPLRAYPEYELLQTNENSLPCAQSSSGFIFRLPDGAVGCLDSLMTIEAVTGAEITLQTPDLLCCPSPAISSNFLTGNFAHRHHLTFKPADFVRPAMLLAIAGALFLLTSLIHWRQLSNREKSLQNDIRQTFATAFPGTPIVDPVLQWESRVRELGSTGNQDALDEVLSLASRLGVTLNPQRIESRDGQVRITVTETEFARVKPLLQNMHNLETTPAESGYIRLEFRKPR